MTLTNKDLIEKVTSADLQAGGGYMSPEQANRFIDLTIDESVMLKMVRVHRATRPSGELDKLNIGAPVTEYAPEAQDTGNVYNATFGKVEWNVKKLRSAFNISSEALEDNIEGAGFQDTLVRAFAKRIATDLEMAAIQGDSSITDSSDPVNRLLKSLDGWKKQTDTGAHYVDAAGGPISKDLFSAAIKAMPAKYLTRYNELRFFASPTIYQDYLDSLTDRQTTLGDTVLTQTGEVRVFGIPLVRVPLIPENLGETQDESFVWLTFPQNFIWVVFRDIKVNWFFNGRTDNWENTTYTRVDARIENLDAVVRINNIKRATA